MNEINQLEKQIHNLTIKSKGIELEYQYVNELKNKKILELQEIVEKDKEQVGSYKKELENCQKKMEKYKEELEKIKNSRWWKLRKIIKRGNKKEG